MSNVERLGSQRTRHRGAGTEEGREKLGWIPSDIERRKKKRRASFLVEGNLSETRHGRGDGEVGESAIPSGRPKTLQYS